VKDADLSQVVKILSAQTGVEITVAVTVTGGVTIKAENEPLEKSLDRIMTCLGQRNYVLAKEGRERKKIYILPRPGDTNPPVPSAKAHGKLKNGKEIEFFPSEIMIYVSSGIDGHFRIKKWTKTSLIHSLERKFGLSFIREKRIGLGYGWIFRVLGSGEVIDLVYLLNQANVREEYFIGNTVPIGMGSKSFELPDEFHVLNTPSGIMREDEKVSWESRFREANPFVLTDQLGGLFAEGEVVVRIGKEDYDNFSFDDSMSLANDDNGIILAAHEKPAVYQDRYIIFFFPKKTNDEYVKQLSKMNDTIQSHSRSKDTQVYPRRLIF
jgi:hypothetical protein